MKIYSSDSLDRNGPNIRLCQFCGGMEFIDDVVDILGSRKQIDYLEKIVTNGTSADRQIKIFNKNKNKNDVVDNLVSETLEGC